jgi:hypothetical protein
MMNAGQALLDMVRRERGEGCILARVVSVDTGALTIDAVDLDGITLFDIRLQAVADRSDQHGRVCIPAVGSWVILESLGRQESDYLVVAYSQLDQWCVNIQTVSLSADSSKIEAVGRVELGGGQLEPAVMGSRLNTNLKSLCTLLNTLSTALQAFAVVQSAAAAANPATAQLTAALTALQTSIPPINQGVNQVSANLQNHLATKTHLS